MRKFSREAFLLYAVMLAAVAAFVIGHIAYVDLGFSRGEISTSALGGAAAIGALLFAASVGPRRDE
jgi:energy-converting hydrogenase Eha subunit G